VAKVAFIGKARGVDYHVVVASSKQMSFLLKYQEKKTSSGDAKEEGKFTFEVGANI